MDLLQSFKQHLIDKKSTSLTIKNYLADVRKFLAWYEATYKISFNPSSIEATHIEAFKTQMQAFSSLRSVERYLSTLRKFFSYLKDENSIPSNPFVEIKQAISAADSDNWKLKEFKDFLYEAGCSALTIKNYLADIKAFKNWTQTSVLSANYIVKDTPLSDNMGYEAISEYKNRLIDISHLSPSSVNRKLSSIRKYIEFARLNSLVISNIPEPVITPTISLQTLATKQDQAYPSYSTLAPLRLLQRFIFPFYVLGEWVTSGTAEFLIKTKLNTLSALPLERFISRPIRNIPKDFYAPHLISQDGFAWYKRVYHSLRHSRPAWYIAYHRNQLVHYVHFAVLIIFASALGFALFHGIFNSQKLNSSKVLGVATSSSRILPFHGRLTNSNGEPLTKPVDLRLAIYSSPVASGSALLWQETQSEVEVDKDGNFSILLGSQVNLLDAIFADYVDLYLGITVGQSPELEPRQRIAQVGYARNSQTLESMPPISETNSSSNVILALDSSGNLSIGGNGDHAFAAIGGEFKLAGATLLLATVTGSEGDVIVRPDGMGSVSIEKAIVNRSDTGALPGSVEVGDQLFVNVSEPQKTALIVNNNTYNDIFAASVSGVMRFVIKATGYVGINNGSPTHALDVNGDIAVSGKTIFNDVAYSWPEKDGEEGQILSTNGKGGLSWISKSALSSPFTEDRAIYSNNSTVDFFVGGQDSASAKFGVVGVNSTTPQLRVLNGSGKYTYMTSDGILATSSNQDINIGSSTTGAVRLSPGGVVALSALPNGNIGVGVLNPVFKFELSDSQATSVAAMIQNSNTGPDADGIAIKLGSTTVGVDNRFITFLNGNGTILGKVSGNISGTGVMYETNGVDFAEYYKKENASDSLEAGDMVCLGNLGGVSSCKSSFSKILGVVTTRPGFVGGSEHAGDSSYVLVGTLGQLEVNLPAGFSIHASEPIGLNSEGKIDKAVQPGFIVGHALETVDSTSGKTKVKVALAPSWWDPEVFFSKKGTLVFQDKVATLASADSEQTYFVRDSSGNIFQRVGNFSDAVIGRVDAATIAAKEIATSTFSTTFASMHELTTDALNVTSDQVKINGLTLKDYIVQVLQASNFALQSSKIDSPLAAIAEIRTNIISPLSGDPSFALSFGEDNLSVVSNNKKVAEIDSEGNARFEGDVSTNSLYSNTATIAGTLATGELNSQTATIAGTLYADTISATNIQGLDKKIQESAQTFLASNSKATSFEDLRKQLTQEYIDISTLSARFALVTEGIISLGTSTFREVSVYDNISIGSTFFISSNSINVIGQDLEIQPLRQGGVSFLAGLVRIDPDGSLNVTGNAYFASDVSVHGVLSAGILTPLADSDFTVKLMSSSQDSDSYKPEFVIQNASGSSILRVSQTGELQASGSGTFAKLNFNLISQAYALNDTEAIATGSAGGAILKANKPELTIRNPAVTQSSLIYITPTGNTDGSVLYLMRLRPGISFTVGINDKKLIDIPFNWIIVN